MPSRRGLRGRGDREVNASFGAPRDSILKDIIERACSDIRRVFESRVLGLVRVCKLDQPRYRYRVNQSEEAEAGEEAELLHP